MSTELLDQRNMLFPIAATLITKSAVAPRKGGLRSAIRTQNKNIKKGIAKIDTLSISSPTYWNYFFHLLKTSFNKVVSRTQQPCCLDHSHSAKECLKHQQIHSPSPKKDFSFWDTAEIVTLEAKFHVIPWIAEFWCTITSVFFALPATLYLIPLLPKEFYLSTSATVLNWSTLSLFLLNPVLLPLSRFLVACSTFNVASLSAFAHFYIGLTILVAFTSTVYHCTLWNICSVMDVLLATIAFWSNTIFLLQSQLLFPALPTALVVSALLTTTFLYKFERHAEVAVLGIGLGVPFAIWGYASIGCLAGAAVGALGLSCFLMDRTKLLVTHSLWHIFGGISMACGVLTIELNLI